MRAETVMYININMVKTKTWFKELKIKPEVSHSDKFPSIFFLILFHLFDVWFHSVLSLRNQRETAKHPHLVATLRSPVHRDQTWVQFSLFLFRTHKSPRLKNSTEFKISNTTAHVDCWMVWPFNMTETQVPALMTRTVRKSELVYFDCLDEVQ